MYSFLALKVFSTAENFASIEDDSITLWVQDYTFPITDSSMTIPRWRTYYVNYGNYQAPRYELYFERVEVEIYNKLSTQSDLTGFVFSSFVTDVMRQQRNPTEDTWKTTSMISFYLRAEGTLLQANQRLYSVLDVISECGGMYSALVMFGGIFMFVYLVTRHAVKRARKRRRRRTRLDIKVINGKSKSRSKLKPGRQFSSAHAKLQVEDSDIRDSDVSDDADSSSSTDDCKKCNGHKKRASSDRPRVGSSRNARVLQRSASIEPRLAIV